MIDPEEYLDVFTSSGISFFTGVPDSLLKGFCECVTQTVSSDYHNIAANEGAAISLAMGYHLGTGEVPLVYMQNSGLGNATNPLLSLTSKDVYSIPMLLLIGWRGEPGIKDEPQHSHQGRSMLDLLQAMDIPFSILSNDEKRAKKQTREAITKAKQNNCPHALIARKGLFKAYSSKLVLSDLQLTREAAIIKAVSLLESDAAVIATTGMASRELFEYRAANFHGHQRDFLTVGGMGHASQIALGLAVAQPNRKVYCFDGDGAAIMHLGALGINGTSGCRNFVHIMLNNGAHASVGGQPTIGFKINFCAIADACGYRRTFTACNSDEIKTTLSEIKKENGPLFLEIRTSPENRQDIGRPTSSPIENKTDFMKFLKETQ